MAHIELPQEELQPLIMSMKRVFAPFIEAIPSIIKIPQEVERLTETIKQDVKSGQPDRFVSGSKKSKDSVDMIGMMRTYIDSNSDEGKKRQKDLQDLERIAQERAKAEADLEKVLQTGTPAEITENNEVKILNEKEIIEKQKELLKTQSDSTFIEEKIADEKSKGEDADSDELVILQEALENNNTLLQEQTEVLGDRLPRQKVKETVGAKDFIPAPLMEAYDNIAESAMESGRALGSIFQPLIGLKKLFTKKKEYEEDDLEERKEKDEKMGLAILLTTLKFIALAATLAVFTKGVYDLGKMLGFFKKKPGKDEQQEGESVLDYRERVDNMSDKSEVEKTKLKTESMDPVSKYLYSNYGDGEKDLAAASQKDENFRAKQMRENYNKENAKFLKDTGDNLGAVKDKKGDTNVFQNNVDQKTTVVADTSAKRANEPYSVIG